ncbi:Murein hydrolase activator EnvC [bioreactor metagenome]|uniref:Murein hydrolase activator EnvC n=1 Tax=bioreactor metagenome TaxID=1076179 RepID=A0A644YVW5_9ZZZZ
MRNNRWVAWLVVCSLIVMHPWVIADEIDDYKSALDAANAQKQDLYGKIIWAEHQTDSILYELSVVDWELDWTENELNYLAGQKDVAMQNIAAGNIQLDELNQLIHAQDQVSKQRLRSLYENGSISYLEVFFGSSSFSEFLTQFEQITQLFQKDIEILEQQRKLKSELEAANLQLENNLAYLGSLEYQAQVREDELSSKREERSQLMNNILSQKESWQRAYDEFERQAVALEATIRDLQKQNQGPSYGTGIYVWPVPSTHYTTDEYGWRDDPFGGYNTNFHGGLDIAGYYGADIKAVDAGTVIYAGWNSGGYGNLVMIDHGNGIVTLYGHCSELYVEVWDVVDRGDIIASVGSTGWSTGPHLHIEFRVNGERVNPRDYIGW